MLSSARLRFADVEWQKGCLGSAGKLATVFRHEPEGHHCGSRLRGRAGVDMAGDAGRTGEGSRTRRIDSAVGNQIWSPLCDRLARAGGNWRTGRAGHLKARALLAKKSHYFVDRDGLCV